MITDPFTHSSELEVLHHPHVRGALPIVNGYMTSVGRLQPDASRPDALPQLSSLALKIDVQQHRTILDLFCYQQSLPVLRPVNAPQLVQAFGINDLRRVPAQGANFDGAIRAACKSKTGAVRGQYAE